eukprot:1157425-Pelagomonas_calceolata.AAC.2
MDEALRRCQGNHNKAIIRNSHEVRSLALDADKLAVHGLMLPWGSCIALSLSASPSMLSPAHLLISVSKTLFVACLQNCDPTPTSASRAAPQMLDSTWRRRWMRIEDTEQQRPDPLTEFLRHRPPLHDVAEYQLDVQATAQAQPDTQQAGSGQQPSQGPDEGQSRTDQDPAMGASHSGSASRSGLGKGGSANGLSVTGSSSQGGHTPSASESSSGADPAPPGPLAVDPPTMPVRLLRGVSGTYVGPGK